MLIQLSVLIMSIDSSPSTREELQDIFAGRKYISNTQGVDPEMLKQTTDVPKMGSHGRRLLLKMLQIVHLKL